MDRGAGVYIADGHDRRRRRRAGRLARRSHHRCRAAASSSPGFVDLAARLREPGLEHKATLESELAPLPPAA